MFAHKKIVPLLVILSGVEGLGDNDTKNYLFGNVFFQASAGSSSSTAS